MGKLQANTPSISPYLLVFDSTPLLFETSFMRKFTSISIPILLGCFLASCTLSLNQNSMNNTTPLHPPLSGGQMQATFAGGCFWCLQPAFDAEPGVLDAVVGYAGGHVENPTFEQVFSKTTGHREAIQITYDPDQVSYQRLVEIFFRQIDPTDAGGQFADRGENYTTAIWYQTDEEKTIAESVIQSINDSDKFDAPVATKVLPFMNFYPAEDYHQDYYKKSALHYNLYKK